MTGELVKPIGEKIGDIEGVVVKKLRSHPDDRGFFREIIRITDPLFRSGVFGQWSHSKMSKNVVKAWHFHHVQTDWWYVPIGSAEIALVDNRPESPTYGNKMTFYMGDVGITGSETISCVRIPPGVLHGCKVVSDEAHLFYITSHVYNPNEEGRHPYNSQFVKHSWGNNVIVTDKDKVTFIPTSTRIKMASGE